MKGKVKQENFVVSDTDDEDSFNPNLVYFDETSTPPHRTTRTTENSKSLPCKSHNSRCHKSRGKKNFLKHCTDLVIEETLCSTFHLCRVESNKSSRKLSLRTQSIPNLASSCSSVSSSPVNSFCESCTSSDDSFEEFSDDVFKLKLEDPYIGRHSETKRKETCNTVMGCGSSIRVNPQSGTSANPHGSADGDSDDRIRLGEDIGMNTKSNADLLEAHRLHSTDVSKGLEDRWIRSHFSNQSLTKSDTRAKRRRMSCMSTRSFASQHGSSEHVVNGMHSDGEMNRESMDDVKDVLSLIHFNDVYEISERRKEPIGGAARFSALVKSKITEALHEKTGERPLVVFCGDCLNPSTLSCATRGRHMIDVLNNLEVDVSVFGNHEFDFGVEHAANCIKEMDAPWLLGNVVDKLTNRNLAEGLPTWTVKRKSGLLVGFIGLVEEEWLDTLATVDRNNLDYNDYVKVGKELAKQLREEGVDFVIALTHMRWPNDIRLAREVPDIDLILGGHDHEYGVKDVDECLIIKSGSDFRNFSSIDIFLRSDGCVDVRLVRHDVTSAVKPDEKMKEIVHRYVTTLEKSLETCIGRVEANLNGKFKTIRSEETTLGNFVADIMATVTKSDIVLINSGTFRSDAIHASGDFTLHDLMTILPINDTVVIIVVTGHQLLQALENGVSKYPKLEGRFPHVSGLYFAFNPDGTPGSRIIPESIRIRGMPLDLNRDYKMATKAYVARGKDGYGCLAHCKILNDPDSGPLLSTVVRNHIMNVRKLMDFEKNMDCQVNISGDGRQISCNKSELDITLAFKDCDTEDPLHTIQKCMKPVIDCNNNKKANSVPVDTSQDVELQNAVHLPNFINITSGIISTHTEFPLPQQLADLRKAVQISDCKNAELLAEREQSPTDLRWQITPLIEARIFRCSQTDDGE